MSDIITDAAIEAASNALQNASVVRFWSWELSARDAITAALPHIESEIRQRIFAELIAAANHGGVEADISWYKADDTIESQYLTNWLREHEGGK